MFKIIAKSNPQVCLTHLCIVSKRCQLQLKWVITEALCNRWYSESLPWFITLLKDASLIFLTSIKTILTNVCLVIIA